MNAHPFTHLTGTGAATLGTALPRRPAAKRPQRSLSASLRGLLLETALLAVFRGMDADALAIKQLLIGLGIDRKGLGLSMALLKLQRGDQAGCLLLLEQEVLAHERGHELALAVQAHVWHLQGLPEGRAQANALMATSADPMVRSMARVLS